MKAILLTVSIVWLLFGELTENKKNKIWSSNNLLERTKKKKTNKQKTKKKTKQKKKKKKKNKQKKKKNNKKKYNTMAW